MKLGAGRRDLRESSRSSKNTASRLAKRTARRRGSSRTRVPAAGEKAAAVAVFSDTIASLDGPHYAGEPDRAIAARGHPQNWWEWWTVSRRRLWSAYAEHLEEAKVATAELRKREELPNVGRKRRGYDGPDLTTTTAPENEMVDIPP